MAERNTAEELDDVYEIKYSTDAMTGGADKIRIFNGVCKCTEKSVILRQLRLLAEWNI